MSSKSSLYMHMLFMSNWCHYTELTSSLLSGQVNQNPSTNSKNKWNTHLIPEKYPELHIGHLNGVAGVKKFNQWVALTHPVMRFFSWFCHWCDSVSLCRRHCPVLDGEPDHNNVKWTGQPHIHSPYTSTEIVKTMRTHIHTEKGCAEFVCIATSAHTDPEHKLKETMTL